MKILNPSSPLSKFMLVCAIFIAFLGVLYFLGGNAQAKSVYEPTVPQAAKTYAAALTTLCESELALTSAKLLDHANNAFALSPDEVKALEVKKSEKKCGAESDFSQGQ